MKTRAVNSRKHPALSLNNAEIKAEKHEGGGEGGVIGVTNMGSTWGFAIGPAEASGCGRRASSVAGHVAAPEAREGRPTVHLRTTSRASPIREANASRLMENKGSNLHPSASNFPRPPVLKHNPFEALTCRLHPVHSHVLVPALPLKTGDVSSASCSRDTKKRRVRSPHTANKLSRTVSNNLAGSWRHFLSYFPL